jgi:hypothetical protein
MPSQSRAPARRHDPPGSADAGPAPAAGGSNSATAQDAGLSGNPMPVGYTAGNGDDRETQFAPVGAEDLTGLPGSTTGAGQSTDRKVRVIAPWTSPVVVAGAGRVEETDLVVDDAAGSTVTEQIGNVQSPNEYVFPDTSTLYIDGSPSSSDIEQGNVGDCYFLAALSSIVNGDSAHLMSLISAGTNQATITFFYYDPSDGSYKPEPVTVTHELMQRTDENGDPTRLYGAAVRVAEQPKTTEWSADVQGTSLSIDAAKNFEVALWVALIEKAYQKFSEQHGQYGGSPDVGNVGENATQDQDGNQVPGAEITDGGWEFMVYPMFYGERVVENQTEDTTWTAGENPVVQNAQAVRRLLMLQGKGLEDGQQAFLTASGQDSVMVERLSEQISLVLREAMARAAASAAGGIGSWGPDLVSAWMDGTLELDAKLLELRSFIEGPWTDASTDANKEILAGKCEDLTDPAAYPMLHADDAPARLTELLELLLVVAQLGTDTSNGRRQVYTAHAYSVLSVAFRDEVGATLDLDPAGIPGNLESVSAERSSVQLRNPHHTNEPDADGEGPVDGSDDGEFTFTLDQFFRCFTAIDSGVVGP